MNEYWQQEFSKCTSAFHPDFDMEDIICLLTALLKQLLTDNSGVEDAMSKMKKVDVEMEKKWKWQSESETLIEMSTVVWTMHMTVVFCKI